MNFAADWAKENTKSVFVCDLRIHEITLLTLVGKLFTALERYSSSVGHCVQPAIFFALVKENLVHLVQAWANFSAEGPQSQILSFKGPHIKLPRLFSKLDCHAVKTKHVLKSFENTIQPQYGNALHTYNAFIRYQAVRKREKRESCSCLIQVIGGPQESTRRAACGPRAVVCPPLI